MGNRVAAMSVPPTEKRRQVVKSPSKDGPETKARADGAGTETGRSSGPSVRITNQFRKGPAMVYDLSCEDVRLTLEMTGATSVEHAAEWRVEAFARHDPQRPKINGSGATRRDALQSVALAWEAQRGVQGFPAVNWEGVADALSAVRAI
jgi:hypothetical protein